MEIFVGIFVFCIILFVYLHVKFQLKTSDDLEVYEIERPDKNRLEELCDLRQPLLFDYENSQLSQTFHRAFMAKNYGGFDIKMRTPKDTSVKEELFHLPLKLSAALELVRKEAGGASYFTENSTDFLEETGLSKILRSADEFIRPYMYCNGSYDFMVGGDGVYTPLKYEINYRNYIYVTEGEVTVRLTPPKNVRYLDEKKDYENFEFRSPVDIWNTQPEYTTSMEKTKYMDVKLVAGRILYLPPYWWYSIRFDKTASLLFFRYRTYMNNVAILPRLIMCTLQNHNIKWDATQKADTVREEPKASATPLSVIDTTDSGSGNGGGNGNDDNSGNQADSVIESANQNKNEDANLPQPMGSV